MRRKTMKPRINIITLAVADLLRVTVMMGLLAHARKQRCAIAQRLNDMW